MSVDEEISKQLRLSLFSTGVVFISGFIPDAYSKRIGDTLELLFEGIESQTLPTLDNVPKEHTVTPYSLDLAQLRFLLGSRKHLLMQQVLSFKSAVKNLAEVFFPRGYKILWSETRCLRQTLEDTENHQGYHQDGRAMGQYGKGITVWIPLSECGENAPGLEILRAPCGMLFPLAEQSENIEERSAWVVEQCCAPWRPRLLPGDVIVFTDDIIHRTYTTEVMKNDSRFLEFRVVKKDSNPWFRKDEEVRGSIEAKQDSPYPMSMYYDTLKPPEGSSQRDQGS